MNDLRQANLQLADRTAYGTSEERKKFKGRPPPSRDNDNNLIHSFDDNENCCLC